MNKTIKSGHFNVDIPMFHTLLQVYYGEVPGIFEKTISETTLACYTSYEGYSYIYIRNLEDRTSLVHELIHMVFQVFLDKGIPISKENEEVFAYFYEHLYSECMKEIGLT